MGFTLDEEKIIFNFLHQHNCCLRCCYRFIGDRSQDNYKNADNSPMHLDHLTTETSNFVLESPCIACLGILQDRVVTQVLQKVKEKVEEENYDCKTFGCALTIPICISLREKLLQLWCATELNLSQDLLTLLKHKLQGVKDIWKLVAVPKLEEMLKKGADMTTPSPFLIEIFLAYENDEKECEALYKQIEHIPNKQKRKYNSNKFSRKSIEALLSETSDEKFAHHFTTKIFDATSFVSVNNVICSHSSIFIGGRYNKLSRQLSQTPWFINGEKKMETSVQDILCTPIAEAVKANSIKFLSSGREDVDVRNIYSGRPFGVELINPKMTIITSELLSDFVKQVNQSSKQVQIVSNLKVLTRTDLKLLKDGETTKTKFYRAVCVYRSGSRNSINLDKLNALKRLKIIQKTPLRVLHRRPLSPRTRYIYEMRARWVKPQELEKLLQTATENADAFFVLDVKTQAGTYVKEFVHGDFGRTKPSLCDILEAEIDIVALDVTGINLNWP